jgi:hypothetical protein
MPGCLVGSGFFLAGFGRDHEEAAAAHAALGSDPVGKMLCLGSGPSQGGNLHVVVVVEVDVKRRYREIMMAVIVLHQASRRVADPSRSAQLLNTKAYHKPMPTNR